MNLDLDEAALFLRVAELGSLSAAARERHAPVSLVSRTLARLEERCGARLMHRSTHGLSLTDEGDTLLSYGQRLLDTTAELDSELSGKLSGPGGWVRVSVSPLLAECVIAPSLQGLYNRHPALHLDINADAANSALVGGREGVRNKDINGLLSWKLNDEHRLEASAGYSRQGNIYAGDTMNSNGGGNLAALQDGDRVRIVADPPPAASTPRN